ncbi:12962_t:CDS:2 [Rhizophagus irregularis]|nr:12962_t:CDS:2 [Rhizophagus irregularis]
MSKNTKKFPMFSMLLDVDSYDVLIKDIKSNNLHQEISKQLRIKYLSNSAQELDEVEGKMFDTRAPKTTICEEVLRSFNLTISDAKNPIKVTLNKRPTKVELSPSESNFNDLNLLGADFLDLYDAQLFADYGESYFTIKFKNITNEKTVTNYTANTTDINPIVFAGPIFILLVVILVKKPTPQQRAKQEAEKLVLFEQSLSEREKEMTDRENLLHQREEEYTKKLEHAKLEIQKTITNKIKMENNVYLSAESQRCKTNMIDS